jgi:hypothetical protein
MGKLEPAGDDEFVRHFYDCSDQPTRLCLAHDEVEKIRSVFAYGLAPGDLP